MADEKETAEQIAYRRLAISSQLKYLAEKVENGTYTGFSLVWDGKETLIAGDCITDVSRFLELTIAVQREQMQAARAAMAQVQAAQAAVKPPSDGNSGSNLN